MPTMDQLIENVRADVNGQIARYNDLTTQITTARRDGNTGRADTLREERDNLHTKIEAGKAKLEVLRAEHQADLEVEELQRSNTPTPAAGAGGGSEYTHGGSGDNRRADGPTWVRADSMEPAAVARGQRVNDHPAVRRVSKARASADAAIIGQHGDLGQFVRSLTTSSGSAIVPTLWASELIDKARNKAAVLQAGAPIIPMDAKTVQIGRLTGDPAVAFREEGAQITASEPTFDNVTLTAKTLSTLVVGTLEWFQDADNANDVVTDAIASAMAGHIDLVALYGGITEGHGAINLSTPPNPRGILAALNATAASSVLGRGEVDGTEQTTAAYWAEVIDAVYTPRDHNEEPNALIWSSKLARQYAKAVDTTGQPLQMPADVAALARYVTNQVPSYTLGTGQHMTDLFVGDFTKLLIGQRLDITLQVLTERYADTGEIGIVAHWRGDVQPARPRAFAVHRGLKGAA